jgi:hypothetical protein
MAKKAARKPRTIQTVEGTEATETKAPNASEAIRAALEAHPEKGPKDIAALLVKAGFTKVTPTFVSNIKSKAKGSTGTKTRKARGPNKPKVVATGFEIGNGNAGGAYGMAVAFAKSVGGIKIAQQILEDLAGIQ